ncbi:unnamed protein product [Cuscuta campestris]|uniref:Uncharacterized protein n=1 Tax=Cuscuta campestris TaxID=132261 RepID=A0A484N9Q8_9ASTE|nr:unnamed protein product [Cuscuta campestris]
MAVPMFQPQMVANMFQFFQQMAGAHVLKIAKEENGKLMLTGEYTAQKGIISKVADEFNVSRRSIGDIWCRARKQLKEGVAIDVKGKVYGNTGRKRVVIDVESIPNIPLAQRTTIRSLAAALDNGEVLWDGKIGIFPFVENVAAKRTAKRKSKNREAGFLEMKQLLSVTKEVTKDMLVNQVIPAIHEKWPSFLDRSIVLQQDNARPHISGTNQDFMTAGNANELVEAVRGAYAAITAETLNKVWLSYQDVMQQVMNDEGGNKYKLPHMANDRLARQGALPVYLNVPHTLVEKGVRVLAQDQPEFMPEDGEDFSSSEMN